ncbi:MAG TPA: TolC family outer membrane protein [Burkholderiales bacterium]
MRRKISPRQVMVALAVSVLLAPAVQAENLLQVYELAKQNDPRLRAAHLEFEAIAYGVDQARSGFLPTIAADYNRTQTQQNILSSQNAVFATGSSNYPQREKSLSLTQPVFRLAAWSQYAQAKAAEKQAAAAFAAAQQDLMVRTATAYLGALAARDNLELARTEREAIQSQLTLASTKYSSGQVTVVNLRDAEARAALKDAEMVAAENDLNDKMQALAEITGTVPHNLAPLNAPPTLTPPEPADLSQWVQGALDRNLLLEARNQAVEVARHEVEKQRAAYYPTVDVSATTDQKNTGGSLFGGGSNVRETDLMVRLHIPIFDGFNTHAVTAAAAKRFEESKEDLERDRRAIERQTRAAYLGVTGGITKVKALDQSVSALDAARGLKEEGYRSGLATVLAVLDAERDLYSAKRNAAQAKYDYLLNSLKLKQAAGTLGDDDMRRIGSLTK